jgi:excisionase family DNA binding protein
MSTVRLRLVPPEPSGARLTYTVNEVSDLLGLGLGLTYASIRSGEIPARKLGSRWVIPKAAFHAWLDATSAEHKEVS